MKKKLVAAAIVTGVLMIVIAAVLALSPAFEHGKSKPLAAPENVRLSVEDGAFCVEWSPVEGADRYYVYRIMEGEESFSSWGITECTSITDSTLAGPALCAYKVFPAYIDGKEFIRGDEYAVTQYARLPAIPRINSMTMTSSGCVIRWERQDTVTEYEILRCDTEDGEFSPVGTTEGAEFIDRGASYEKSYFYILRAIVCEGDERWASAAAELPRTLTSPKGVSSLRKDEHTALISWEPVEGAENYIVFRTSHIGRPPIIIGMTNSCVFSDTSLDGDTAAFYSVQASSKAMGVANVGRPSAECEMQLPLP